MHFSQVFLSFPKLRALPLAGGGSEEGSVCKFRVHLTPFSRGFGGLSPEIFEYLECRRSHFYMSFLGLFFKFFFLINQFSLLFFSAIL